MKNKTLTELYEPCHAHLTMLHNRYSLTFISYYFHALTLFFIYGIVPYFTIRFKYTEYETPRITRYTFSVFEEDFSEPLSPQSLQP